MTNLMGCENPDQPTPEETKTMIQPYDLNAAHLEDEIYKKFQVESEALNAAINNLFE